MRSPIDDDKRSQMFNLSPGHSNPGLNATDQSNESSSSQEGNRSQNDKEAEEWLSSKKDTSGVFEESNHGSQKWGDLSDENKDNDRQEKDNGFDTI